MDFAPVRGAESKQSKESLMGNKRINMHGPGIFADTTFIQRVNTTGGKAPFENGMFVGQVAKVPYTADYFFYRQSND
jgi:hypothetical protein